MLSGNGLLGPFPMIYLREVALCLAADAGLAAGGGDVGAALELCAGLVGCSMPGSPQNIEILNLE